MSAHALPYSFTEARDTARRFQQAQLDGERQLKEASKALATAEKAYRMALAEKIVQVHADGSAWTVAQDLARGDKDVADLRYKRDVAKGVFEATQTASWRHTANRKDCLALIRWSMGAQADHGEEPDREFEDVSAPRVAA